MKNLTAPKGMKKVPARIVAGINACGCDEFFEEFSDGVEYDLTTGMRDATEWFGRQFWDCMDDFTDEEWSEVGCREDGDETLVTFWLLYAKAYGRLPAVADDVGGTVREYVLTYEYLDRSGSLKTGFEVIESDSRSMARFHARLMCARFGWDVLGVKRQRRGTDLQP